MHFQRGDSVCTNDLLIRRNGLERRLLQRLQEKVLREEVIDYAVERLRQELQRKREELDLELARLREEKKQHETEIARLVEAIATAKDSSSLTEAIAEREKKIRQITDRLVEPGPGSLQEKLDERRTFAASRLTDLRRLLSKPANVHEARALLAEQFGKFIPWPFERKRGSGATRQRGRSIYSVKSWYAWMVPGARHARYCHKLTSLLT